MAGFAPHGKIRMDVDGRVVSIGICGPFNQEAVAAFVDLAKPLLDVMRGQPWAALVVAEGDCLLTPEAEALLRAAEPEYAAAGRVATAFVLDPERFGAVVQAQWRRVYVDCGSEIAFFAEQAAAREWIDSALRGVDAGGAS